MEISYATSVQSKNKSEVTLKQMFSFNAIENGKTSFGTVEIPPGARIPEVGMAAHDEDEYCLVVKGSMVVTVGKVDYQVSVGDATLIPAGEAHITLNAGNEICEVVWALVKRD